MQTSDKFWRNLIESSLQTTEDEISCAECFKSLDEYVDLLDAGGNPAVVLPKLEQHLAVCSCCHKELDALMIALRTTVEAE